MGTGEKWSDEPDRCEECDWPLTPRVPEHAMQWCPCCSSRWHMGVQVHWGSHNDYATYLCKHSTTEKRAIEQADTEQRGG